MTRRRDDCFRAALGYLGRDWSALALCPPDHAGVPDFHARTCSSPGKRPLGRWKAWQSRLPTVEELAEQFEAVPGANVGVVLGRVSGLVGIDADGPGGERLLDQLAGEEGMPRTPAFTTARGFRLLFALEPGTTCRTWSVRAEDGEVKVLAEGSLTTMPPSRHASGKRYRWRRRRGPGDLGPAPAPAWLTRPRSSGRRADLPDVGEPIPEGRRLPPLADGEVRTISRSAATYRPG